MRIRTSLAVIAAATSALALALPTAAGAATFQAHRLIAIRSACALVQPLGYSHCNLKVLATPRGVPNATTAPSGYGAPDLRAAYGLTSTGSNTQTIAIVDAYDDKTAEADLGVYRSQYGLGACTTANGCFKKVNQ